MALASADNVTSSTSRRHTIGRRFVAFALFVYSFLLVVCGYSPTWSYLENLGALGLIATLAFVAATTGLPIAPRFLREILPLALLVASAVTTLLTSMHADASATSFLLKHILFLFVAAIAVQLVGSYAHCLWALNLGLILQVLAALAQPSPSSTARAAGFMGNSNIFALALLFAANLNLAYSFRSSEVAISRSRRGLPLVHQATAFLFLWFQLYSTGSRKGMLGTLLLICIFAFAHLYSQSSVRSRFTGILMAILGPVILLSLVSDSPFADRFADFLGFGPGAAASQEASSSYRAAMAQDAFALWADAPLFGLGVNGFASATGWYGYSHNNIAELLASTGALGFLGYELLLIMILVKYTTLFRERRTAESLMLLVPILTMLLLQIGYVTYIEKLSYFQLAILLGLPTAASRGTARVL